MNLFGRLMSRITAADLARNDRILERAGWAKCSHQGCTAWAAWAVAREPGHCYCDVHKDDSGKPMVSMVGHGGFGGV